MKRSISIICILILVLSLALSLCACSEKKLNGKYEHNNDEDKIHLSFHNSMIDIGYMEYDPLYDIYSWRSLTGEYRIIEDSDNPDGLLIEISIPEREKSVYTFEETETGIVINGKEFEQTEAYTGNYWIKKILYNLGIIESMS